MSRPKLELSRPFQNIQSQGQTFKAEDVEKSKFEANQRRATRMVKELKKFTYETRLNGLAFIHWKGDDYVVTSSKRSRF